MGGAIFIVIKYVIGFIFVALARPSRARDANGFTLRTYVHLLPEDMPEVPFGNLVPVRPLRQVA